MKHKNTLLEIQKNFIEANGKKKYIGMYIFGFFVSIILILEPFFFIKIIATVENFYKTNVFNFGELLSYIALWSGFMVFSLTVNYIYRYYFLDISNIKYYDHLFHKYTKSALEITYGEFLTKKPGSFFSQLQKGIRSSFSFLFFFFMEIVRSMSGIIVVIIVLFFINPIMTLTSISMLPILIYMGIYYNKKTQHLQKEINDFDDENYGILSDSITNTGLVKNLSLETKVHKIISKNIKASARKQFQVSKRWSASDVSTGFLVMIARALTVVMGVYLISLEKMGLAELFLFFSFIGWIYFPLSFVFRSMRRVQEDLTSTGKFFEEYNKVETEKNLETGKTLKNPQGNITFKNVAFSYSPKVPVIKKLNFEIAPGEKVAFVGNTGAGKSTIVNLIFRLWDINSGKILLDGESIQNLSKKSLRKNIGLVAQDNTLFNLSIKENLLFAKPKATKKELETALKKARANFVFDLENGINTIIGERGLKLSGGEKQLLNIARLFLKDPKILILDEATSALDNKTEKYIQASLDELMKGRTSIIIAHRLSTIQNADRIYMLEKGQIIESGKYDELIQKQGKFAELANPKHLIIN